MCAENRDMNRLRNMAVFFVRNTMRVNEPKLEKLFYFADLYASQEDGLLISGLDWIARETGSRPVFAGLKLYDYGNFQQFLRLDERGYFQTDLEFCLDKFSPWEIGILESVAREYRDKDCDYLSEDSHTEDEPWDRARKAGGYGARIDFRTDEEDLPAKERERRKANRESLANAAAAFAAFEEFLAGEPVA